MQTEAEFAEMVQRGRASARPAPQKAERGSVLRGLISVARMLMTCGLGLYAAVVWFSVISAAVGRDTIPIGGIVQDISSLIAAYVGARALFWFCDEISPRERRAKA